MPQQQQERPDVSLVRVASKPGIRRDGTTLDGQEYVDGQWVRFYRGRPRKMGGWRRINTQMSGISRALGLYKDQAFFRVVNLHPNGLEVLLIDSTGAGASPTDRTPVGFTASANNLWQFDAMFDSAGGGVAKLIAHAGPNALNIDDRTLSPVWYGNLYDVSLLTEATGTGPPNTRVSGGCVVLHPFLFIYGNDGYIANSDKNKPNVFTIGGASLANAVNVAGTKVVKGLPLRGGSSAPSGLFWALDALIRVSFTNDTRIFAYDTVSGKSSILAQNSPVEFDGIYYWIGIDRFLMYNGSLRELPNQLNLDWFFENLNWDNRNKIVVTTEPRFGEIWWLFPFGASTEPNHAIIYNVREETWYDTPLDRTSAVRGSTFRMPLMMGSTSTAPPSATAYPIYLHEFGKNSIEGDNVAAIQSFFETANFGVAAADDNAQNRWLDIERVEPDFKQVGAMKAILIGQEYANDVPTSLEFPFAENQRRVDIRKQYRHVRLRFESNVVNGDYFMGKTIVNANLGEARE